MLSLTPASALAICSISTTSVAFGEYDVFGQSPNDSTGSVSVGCDTPTSYTIALSVRAGDGAQRALVNGPHVLHYNLFTDAGRYQIWGDGSSGTTVVSDTSSGPTSYTVYGRIPARQNVGTGIYTDVITVTVSY